MRGASTLIGICLASVSLLASGHAYAQSMALEVDQSKPMRFNTPITGVVVGNAGIADVIVHDSKTVFFIGKSVGSTHVLAVDQRGRTVFAGNVTVRAPDMNGLLTVQRGRELSTSLCETRCIGFAHPESGTSAMSETIGRATTRSGFAGGSGPK